MLLLCAALGGLCHVCHVCHAVSCLPCVPCCAMCAVCHIVPCVPCSVMSAMCHAVPCVLCVMLCHVYCVPCCAMCAMQCHVCHAVSCVLCCAMPQEQLVQLPVAEGRYRQGPGTLCAASPAEVMEVAPVRALWSGPRCPGSSPGIVLPPGTMAGSQGTSCDRTRFTAPCCHRSPPAPGQPMPTWAHTLDSSRGPELTGGTGPWCWGQGAGGCTGALPGCQDCGVTAAGPVSFVELGWVPKSLSYSAGVSSHLLLPSMGLEPHNPLPWGWWDQPPQLLRPPAAGVPGMGMDQHLEGHSPSRALAVLPTHSSAHAWHPTAIAQALPLLGGTKLPPAPWGQLPVCHRPCWQQGLPGPVPHGAVGGVSCCRCVSQGRRLWSCWDFPTGSLPGRGRRTSARWASCLHACERVLVHVQPQPARAGHVCVRARACAVHTPCVCAWMDVCAAHAACATQTIHGPGWLGSTMRLPACH